MNGEWYSGLPKGMKLARNYGKANHFATDKEMAMSNAAEGVLGIGKSVDFELIVVGKGRCSSSSVVAAAEHSELGPVGALLASSDQGILCSALVIQRHNVANEEDKSKPMHHEA